MFLKSIEHIRNIVIILLILALTVCISVIFLSTDIAFAQTAEDEIYYGYHFYSNAGNTTHDETIQYARKEIESTLINNNYPIILNNNNQLTNFCAPVAGASLVTFYDRYFDNLIPDATVGYFRNGDYYYYPMVVNSAKIQNVINTLYTSMGTNTVEPGTTQNMFKNGLQSYINGKGRSISYNNVMSGNELDIEKIISNLVDGKPIVLYVLNYQLAKLVSNNASDVLTYSNFNANHIMVAYGYYKVKYFDSSDVNFRTEILLKVSSGIVGWSEAYYRVDGYGILNDAEAVRVY